MAFVFNFILNCWPKTNINNNFRGKNIQEQNLNRNTQL